MKKITEAQLLREYFGMHTAMLKNNESGLTTEDLIERVIKKLCNKENLQFAKSTICEMAFPEISFEFKGINITLPSLDEKGMFSVNSSLYYGENYNNWAIKFYGQYFDLLLEETEYEAFITKASEYYEDIFKKFDINLSEDEKIKVLNESRLFRKHRADTLVSRIMS